MLSVSQTHAIKGSGQTGYKKTLTKATVFTVSVRNPKNIIDVNAEN